MRLLHILNHLSDRGNGIINLAVDLALEQRAMGHTVAFVCGHGGHEQLLAEHGVEHFVLEQSKAISHTVPGLFRLSGILTRFKPDLVHAHMRTGLILATPWCKILQIPLVAHLHNVHDRESRLMGVADRVIAVSAAVCEDMQRRGIPAKKLRVVLNGTLNSPRTKPLGKIAPQPLARPAITSVAGLYERKGITELIEAFASLASDFPAAHLYLVGDGPIRSQLEAQAAATAAGARIHFTGFQSQPQSYMLASDIFVLASRRESFGLVLTEARQAGCAIVATLVDGIPEALDGGGAGLLVPPRDVPALTAALRSLLSDRTLAQSLSARAQQGLERFTTATMARDVEKIYRELLRRDS